MHFFKKISCLLLLVGFGVAFAEQTHSQSNQDVDQVVKVLDNALEAELARIAKQVSKETDLVTVGRIIEQELPAIKTKVAHAVKHDLTPEQRAIVMSLLANLKNLSTTTTADLLIMAQASETYEIREAQNKALEKYDPDFAVRLKNRNAEATVAEKIALSKELENVDLRDSAFNLVKNFMCKCSYLEADRLLMEKSEYYDREPCSPLLQCAKYVISNIAYPFVVFNDFYFIPGWQNEFKKVGDMFKIVNTVCTELLEVIEQGA